MCLHRFLEEKQRCNEGRWFMGEEVSSLLLEGKAGINSQWRGLGGRRSKNTRQLQRKALISTGSGSKLAVLICLGVEDFIVCYFQGVVSVDKIWHIAERMKTWSKAKVTQKGQDPAVNKSCKDTYKILSSSKPAGIFSTWEEDELFW